MKLKRFRVYDFRSVKDSDWIETDDVTALIGTNESGKTNLLIPLWKLKPANDGEINPLSDFPRKQYHEFRAMKDKPIFITAEFELSQELIDQLVDLTKAPSDDLSVATVSRDYDGYYTVDFPNAAPPSSVERSRVAEVLESAAREISALTPAGAADERVKLQSLAVIKAACATLEGVNNDFDKEHLAELSSKLSEFDATKAPSRSLIAPRFGQLIDSVGAFLSSVTRPDPSSIADAQDLVIRHLPSFVYYSNYGNLDSEIYLPHVIQNMTRKDLGAREEAKTRTLRVLFSFVQLEPTEILELGKDLAASPVPNASQIEAAGQRKKERDVLLQSASAQLTNNFREWWKQGNYRFRFQADGDHFRIWVSDDLRPEDIELENRSTGLQWFLSFYLVFLVESRNAHENAILLLDEPGLSLHPIAQRDLSAFFANLSNTNQMLYTTHSPFMVDPDRLDRVKVVYVDNAGYTRCSANLRIREVTDSQSKSIYAVYAALGLSISQTLFLGCRAVVVEGASDQMYLAAIKNYLVAHGLFKPKREYVFPTAGGVKGIRAVASIMTAKNEELPYVILDSDSSGETLAKQLASGLYSGATKRLLGIGEFTEIDHSEIEDLVPPGSIITLAMRLLRKAPEDFADSVVAKMPIVPQIEAFAEKHEIKLESGWKVELARSFGDRLLKDPQAVDNDYTNKWRALFERLES